MRALSLALAALLVASSLRAADDDVHVLVVGLNDLHGQIAEGKKVGNAVAGGGPVLASWIRDAMTSHDGPSFLAIAGDCAGASPAASALLQDEPVISFVNLLAGGACTSRGGSSCRVVATLGNHELDEGAAELLRLLRGGNHPAGPFLDARWRGARFPVTCCNVERIANGMPLVRRSVTLDADGVPVAFIGAVTKSTPTLVTPGGVAGLRFTDEADAINDETERLLRRGVRAIVVVIHEGGKQDAYDGWTRDDAPAVSGRIRDVVRRLRPEIDLVVSGHSHQFTNARLPRDAGEPVLVTQAWSSGTAFADVELTLHRATRDVTSSRARIVTAWANAGPGLRPAADAAELATRATAAVAPRVQRVVGHAAEAITRAPSEAGESAMGNLVADAQRLATGADVALMNPGGLRADLDAGDVTWGELFAVQPFANTLETIELTGAELRQALEPMGAPDALRVLQVSGLTWSWDRTAPAGRRVRQVSVAGAPLEDARTYRVTVNSFLAGGGDEVNALARGRNPQGGPVDLDALEAAIHAAGGSLHASIEGRIALLPTSSE